MKEYEYNNFVDLMQELSKNFKGEVDKDKIDLYFRKLKIYKLHAVKRGIDYLILTKVYHIFPIVGEIREAIKNSKHQNLIDFNEEIL